MNELPTLAASPEVLAMFVLVAASLSGPLIFGLRTAFAGKAGGPAQKPAPKRSEGETFLVYFFGRVYRPGR